MGVLIFQLVDSCPDALSEAFTSANVMDPLNTDHNDEAKINLYDPLLCHAHGKIIRKFHYAAMQTRDLSQSPPCEAVYVIDPKYCSIIFTIEAPTSVLA
jgi:hypothetical protein